MTRSIVVGYDGTPATVGALDKAVAMARELPGWRIVLVCTHDRPADFRGHPFRMIHPPGFVEVPPDAWIEEWTARVTADMKHAVLRVRMAGIDASAACTLDDPAELVSRIAHDVGAEYVVVADDQVGPLHDLVLGSLTKRLLHTCEIPVVVVPAEK
jgi:nucleotide-binding universal stress UspA family protein